MTVRYFDRDGQPITMWQWAALLASDEYRRVAEDVVADFWVSTVWLGLDHQLLPELPKLTFETMVFTADDGAIVQGPVRYSTLGAAFMGHAWIVKELRRRYELGYSIRGEIPGDGGPDGDESDNPVPEG